MLSTIQCHVAGNRLVCMNECIPQSTGAAPGVFVSGPEWPTHQMAERLDSTTLHAGAACTMTKNMVPGRPGNTAAGSAECLHQA